MAVNQSTRFIELKSDLSANSVRLRSFSGFEQMSRLFNYTLDVVDVGNELTKDEILGSLIGKPVTIRMDLSEGERFFNGVISRVRTNYQEDGATVYRAEMVPALWLLTRTSDCRIFQDDSPDAIIKQILDEHNIQITDSLEGTYPTREYVVQYRETDFNFISRLMEQYGITYFFEHQDGSHKMHLVDSTSGYRSLSPSSVSYYASRQSRGQFEDQITAWEHQYQFITGKYAQTDYDFENPSQSLLKNTQHATDAKGAEDYEFFDFPGEYKTVGEGQTETEIRMEEEEVRFDQVSGSSTCRTFEVGGKFTIEEHLSDSERGKEYMITSMQVSAVDPAVAGGLEAAEYSNSFSCIPASVMYRPPRLTPKPLVSGLHTGVVVGPSGEEIYTDKYGRIKVSFFWDRYGEDDGTDSIFIRVAHQVAGKKWGFFSIPRIGQEVVIDFLEGDPDRPVCVGGVYNDTQMPHYTLPDDMTKTYIKTNSTKGGEGFNELCFEDLADNERFFMHAQKNMDVRVLNDSKENIIRHRHQTIGTEESGEGNQTELVYGNKHQTIKKSHYELIEGSQQIKIGTGTENPGKYDLWVEDSAKMYVGSGGYHVAVDGDGKIKTGGGLNLAVGGATKITSSDAVSIKSSMGDIKGQAMNVHLEGDMGVNIKGGANCAIEGTMETHIVGGMSLVLESDTSVCLKVGGNFISLTPAGIFIQGTLVGINSGGAAMSGSGCSPVSPDDAEEPESAEEAAPEEPEAAHNEQTGHKSCPS